ncbi:hypothetical protein DMC30DRAFT_407375 [Rhodotorula diobovata]|uniref:Uncharacterized protein n=1 Tax=Rhodotorula diobovata TaxID=5288 RepID=A0A5C5FJP2_9BASI|nr:hypothetical protein DMC30DRAFT_407375 [Rhodotorula diobovata]
MPVKRKAASTSKATPSPKKRATRAPSSSDLDDASSSPAPAAKKKSKSKDTKSSSTKAAKVEATKAVKGKKKEQQEIVLSGDSDADDSDIVIEQPKKKKAKATVTKPKGPRRYGDRWTDGRHGRTVGGRAREPDLGSSPHAHARRRPRYAALCSSCASSRSRTETTQATHTPWATFPTRRASVRTTPSCPFHLYNVTANPPANNCTQGTKPLRQKCRTNQSVRLIHWKDVHKVSNAMSSSVRCTKAPDRLRRTRRARAHVCVERQPGVKTGAEHHQLVHPLNLDTAEDDRWHRADDGPPHAEDNGGRLGRLKGGCMG